MLRFGILAIFCLAGLATFAADAPPKSLAWQSGEIVSMKEDVSDRDGKWSSFVYGVQGKEHNYTVVSSAPLKAYLHTTVKFAVEKNLVYIQDLNGKVRKTCLLDQPPTPAQI
jgi:hypothetical protein